VTSGSFPTRVLNGFPVTVNYKIFAGDVSWSLATMRGGPAWFIEARLSPREREDIIEGCYLEDNAQEYAARESAAYLKRGY